MGEPDIFEFLVQGSALEPYRVSFHRRGPKNISCVLHMSRRRERHVMQASCSHPSRSFRRHRQLQYNRCNYCCGMACRLRRRNGSSHYRPTGKGSRENQKGSDCCQESFSAMFFELATRRSSRDGVNDGSSPQYTQAKWQTGSPIQ
jgi:hypothetical protein